MPNDQPTEMTARLNYGELAPDAIKSLLGLVGYVRKSDIEKSLVELIEIRASQINGCAHCLDMHIKIAHEVGETDERLHAIAVWEESPLFSARERTALAWAEAVTLVADSKVPDEMYERARSEFTEQELVDLTVAVVTINSWNRMSVAFRRIPGT